MHQKHLALFLARGDSLEVTHADFSDGLPARTARPRDFHPGPPLGQAQVLQAEPVGPSQGSHRDALFQGNHQDRANEPPPSLPAAPARSLTGGLPPSRVHTNLLVQLSQKSLQGQPANDTTKF